MTRAERRHRRERIIKRRLFIVRNAFGETPETWPLAFDRPGRFAKWNLKCGCPMCKRPRYTRERAMYN